MGESAERLAAEEPPDCLRARRELVYEIDRELDVTAGGWLDRHLAGCAACRRERTLLEATNALLGELPAPALSKDFEARLKARIAREAARPASGDRATPLPIARARPFWQWAAGFAVAASVLFGSVLLVRRALREEAPDGGASGRTVADGEPGPARGGPAALPEDQLASGSHGHVAPPSRGSGTPGVDAQTEEDVIARLDVLENLDIAENMDLIDGLEGPDDPTAALDEDGKG
jgi:hypothetical protein